MAAHSHLHLLSRWAWPGNSAYIISPANTAHCDGIGCGTVAAIVKLCLKIKLCLKKGFAIIAIKYITPLLLKNFYKIINTNSHGVLMVLLKGLKVFILTILKIFSPPLNTKGWYH